MKQQLENEYIKFWIEDGILYSSLKKPIEGNLENMKRLIDLRHQISNNEKQYWCYEFKIIPPYEKEAIRYIELYGQEYLYAAAIIVSSHIQRFILDVFRKKNTKVSIQLFKNKEDALFWLREIKTKNEVIRIN